METKGDDMTCLNSSFELCLEELGRLQSQGEEIASTSAEINLLMSLFDHTHESELHIHFALQALLQKSAEFRESFVRQLISSELSPNGTTLLLLLLEQTPDDLSSEEEEEEREEIVTLLIPKVNRYQAALLMKLGRRTSTHLQGRLADCFWDAELYEVEKQRLRLLGELVDKRQAGLGPLCVRAISASLARPGALGGLTNEDCIFTEASSQTPVAARALLRSAVLLFFRRLLATDADVGELGSLGLRLAEGGVRGAVGRLMSEADDQLVLLLSLSLRVAALLKDRPDFAELAAAYQPAALFEEFLTSIDLDPSVLIDYLLSTETEFLEFLLRFLRTEPQLSEDSLWCLLELADRLASSAASFPYDTAPLRRRLALLSRQLPNAESE